uniref:Uncharacterized protein n=1 Tax=Anguilla anguilla TaxID=7936 RepID=A0A0E9SNN6_ANGAN
MEFPWKQTQTSAVLTNMITSVIIFLPLQQIRPLLTRLQLHSDKATSEFQDTIFRRDSLEPRPEGHRFESQMENNKL